MDEWNDAILELIKDNTRTSIGRISQKELRPNHLVTSIFDNFEVMCRGNPKASIVSNRAKMQELISDNMTHYSGRRRYPTLCTDEFIRDMGVHFILKPKPKTSAIKKGVASMILVIILLASGCGSSQPSNSDIERQLSEEIIQINHENSMIKANLPIFQNTVDTLKRLLRTTNDEHTQNILIKEIQKINSSIEEAKESFATNMFNLEQKKRRLIRLRSSNKELVPLLPMLDSTSSYIIGKDSFQMEPIIVTTTDTLINQRSERP